MKTAKSLITGASSGIGAIYADRLARRGYDLILVGRNREQLSAVQSRIAGETKRSVEVLVADLTNAFELRRVEQALHNDTAIEMLVNNAGASVTSDLARSQPDDLEHMIRLNVLAPTRLAVAALPGFMTRGRGTIINISSAVALAPEWLNAVYGGTKAYMLAMSQRLQLEVVGKGIRVQAVLPGALRTAFWEKAGTNIESLPPDSLMGADDLVDAALAGLDLGEPVTLPSLPDVAQWTAYEAARQSLMSRLSRQAPAARYGVAVANA